MVIITTITKLNDQITTQNEKNIDLKNKNTEALTFSKNLKSEIKGLQRDIKSFTSEKKNWEKQEGSLISKNRKIGKQNGLKRNLLMSQNQHLSE